MILEFIYTTYICQQQLIDKMLLTILIHCEIAVIPIEIK